MPLRVASVTPASEADWSNAYAACEYATFYHSPSWACLWHSVEPARYQPDARRVRFSDGAEAVLPVSRLQSFGGLRQGWVSSPAGTYGGWVSAFPLGAAHAALLRREMGALGEVTWLSNPFAPYGYAGGGQPQSTWVFDLRAAPEELERRWRKHNGTVPRKVRSARRAGLALRAFGPEGLAAFYAVYLECQARWGGGSTFYAKSVFEHLIRLPHAEFWGVYNPAGELVCANVIVRSATHASCWVAVARTAGLAYRPYEFLYVSQIEFYRALGLRWFDLNPSGGHAGVDQFKHNLGATELTCSLVRHRDGLGRLADLLGV